MPTPARALDIAALYQENHAYVMRVIRQRLPRQFVDDVEDISQDVWLLAHRHQGSFEGAAAFRTWITKIAINSALSHVRMKLAERRDSRLTISMDAPTRETIMAINDKPMTSFKVVSDARDHADQLIKCHELFRLIRQLPKSYALALRMRIFGFTDEESAQILGLSYNTIKVRVFRGREMLDIP